MDKDVHLELEMKISCRELRLLLLDEFSLDRKAMEATSNICGTMDKDVLSARIVQHWFHRFKNGKFELNNLPHTRRLRQVNLNLSKKLIEEDPRLTARC